MSRLIVTNVETQNIKFDSDTTAFTIGSDGIVTGNNASATIKLFNGSFGSSAGGGSIATYDIDSTYINSTYDSYDIIGYFRPSNDNAYLYMKLMTGGSVITDNHLGYEGTYAGNGATYFGGNTESSFGFQAYGSGNAVGRGTKLHARVSNVNTTTAPCSITASVNYIEQGGAHQGGHMCGSMIDGQEATVINGFRFQFHSGNIHGGHVTIYGIK